MGVTKKVDTTGVEEAKMVKAKSIRGKRIVDNPNRISTIIRSIEWPKFPHALKLTVWSLIASVILAAFLYWLGVGVQLLIALFV